MAYLRKNWMGPRNPIMKPMDKATEDSRFVQSFAIIQNTGQGNFVISRFQTRARNGLSV